MLKCNSLSFLIASPIVAKRESMQFEVSSTETQHDTHISNTIVMQGSVGHGIEHGHPHPEGRGGGGGGHQLGEGGGGGGGRAIN